MRPRMLINSSDQSHVVRLKGRYVMFNVASAIPLSVSVFHSPVGVFLVVLTLSARAEAQQMITFSGHSDSVTSVASSPNGKWFASSSQNGEVKVWDGLSGKELLTFQGH